MNPRSLLTLSFAQTLPRDVPALLHEAQSVGNVPEFLRQQLPIAGGRFVRPAALVPMPEDLPDDLGGLRHLFHEEGQTFGLGFGETVGERGILGRSEVEGVMGWTSRPPEANEGLVDAHAMEWRGALRAHRFQSHRFCGLPCTLGAEKDAFSELESGEVENVESTEVRTGVH